MDRRIGRIAFDTFEPLHIHEAISKAKHLGNKSGQLLTRKKGMITKPAPTHTFRKDAPDYGWCSIFRQAHIKYALEPTLEAILKVFFETRIEPARATALRDLNVIPFLSFEITRKKLLDGVGL
ncbi:MAG: hypothetical protein WA857_16750 [Candidatus Acidiferrum sp.]